MDGQVSGTWFDSRGVSFPLKGSFTDTELLIEWGSPDIETGRTVYTLSVSGDLVVTDYVNSNGREIRFGEAIYSRK